MKEGEGEGTGGGVYWSIGTMLQLLGVCLGAYQGYCISQ